MRLRIFRTRNGKWVMSAPGRVFPNGSREPRNAEFINIESYRNWLRLLNRGWRVRSAA